MKLNSASFGVEVRDVHMRLMLGENLRTVPTGRVEKETVSTVQGDLAVAYNRTSSVSLFPLLGPPRPWAMGAFLASDGEYQTTQGETQEHVPSGWSRTEDGGSLA